MAALAAPEAALFHSSSVYLKHPRTTTSSSSQISSLQPFPAFSLTLESPARSRSRSRAFRIVAEATSGSGNNGLDDLAARLMEKAGQLLEAVRRRAVELQESSDIGGKLQQALKTANQKLEEFGYDARKNVEKWDRQYKMSERAQQMADFASQQVKNVDEQFGIVQKVRTASSDFRRNWPTYRRRLDRFLQTPLGKTFTTLAFLWFLLSGWLFRIIFFSMWVLPFAAPLLISTAARNSVVQGACPSCKRRFIGNRSQVIVCNYCRAVVWQPREDFSRDKSDPSIIDIDVD